MTMHEKAAWMPPPSSNIGDFNPFDALGTRPRDGMPDDEMEELRRRALRHRTREARIEYPHTDALFPSYQQIILAYGVLRDPERAALAFERWQDAHNPTFFPAYVVGSFQVFADTRLAKRRYRHAKSLRSPREEEILRTIQLGQRGLEPARKPVPMVYANVGTWRNFQGTGYANAVMAYFDHEGQLHFEVRGRDLNGNFKLGARGMLVHPHEIEFRPDLRDLGSWSMRRLLVEELVEKDRGEEEEEDSRPTMRIKEERNAG